MNTYDIYELMIIPPNKKAEMIILHCIMRQLTIV